MTFNTEWLREARHPSADEPFSLPNAIYFLVKFRADLAHFKYSSIKHRIELYFWWSSVGKTNYPDFEWTLRPLDKEFAKRLTTAALLTDYQECVAYWLQGTTPNLLDSELLLRALYEGRRFDGASDLEFPYFLDLIIRNRPDLSQNLDITTFPGQLATLDWWERHGRFEYPKAVWSSASVLASLNQLVPINGKDAPNVPRFLPLLIASRTDLRPALDLSRLTGLLSAVTWWKTDGRAEYPMLSWATDVVSSHLNEPTETTPESWVLPRFIRPLIEERADLRAALELSTPEGRFATVIWWERSGRYEYPYLVWATASVLDALNQVDPTNTLDGEGMPRFVKIALLRYGDLADVDLASSEGLLAAVNWWETSGRIEYPMFSWSTEELIDCFNAPDDGTALYPQVPKFIPILIELRSDLRAQFDASTFAGRIAAMQWWQRAGCKEYAHLKWSLKNTREHLALARTSEVTTDAAQDSLPLFLSLLHASRPDLQATFNTATPAGCKGLIQWWQLQGRIEYPVLGELCITPQDYSDRHHAYRVSIERFGGIYPFGVNIVGFPEGVLGLGEDARTAARALDTVSIPSVLVNAPMIGPQKLDHSMADRLSDDLRYGVSLFCLPPPEMVRLALEGGATMIESDTYKIGAWPWELPRWPIAFDRVHQFVDELWAQSAFVQSALARLGEIPIHRMPMAIKAPAPLSPSRKRFGLPEEPFLFYLMFDGNSWLSRKNPVAGIHAFKRAFGNGQRSVGLVIKAMNIRNDDPIWREVAQIAASDNRIHVISERLSRQDSIDFMACCDAYISLHRSEGFGRVIAEAMAIGQPVVVTNFSGNVDFCDAETAFLVDGELVPLRPGEYLFYEGQYWCDPDVSTAADQLVRVVEDAKARERIAAAGKRRIETDYSIEAVGRAYAERLADLRSEGVIR